MDKSTPAAQSSSPNCLNCGAPLAGKYCYRCGQKDIPRRQTIGELLMNFVGSFTSFESKFFKTIQYLLLKPGFLAMEFNEGRRETYYHPARAYVFISFIFFLIALWPSSEGSSAGDTTPKGWSIQFNFDGADTVTLGKDSTSRFKSRAEYDSVQRTLPPDERDNWFERHVRMRVIDLDQKYDGNKEQMLAAVVNTFKSNFPKVFFFLLPIFALLLKLLYVRRDYYYAEHLVFSIQFYNFFFVVSIIALLLEKIAWLAWTPLAIAIWVLTYLPLAMKRMYRQRWGKTVLKYLLLVGVFIFCIGVGFLVNFFVALFII